MGGPGCRPVPGAAPAVWHGAAGPHALGHHLAGAAAAGPGAGPHRPHRPAEAAVAPVCGVVRGRAGQQVPVAHTKVDGGHPELELDRGLEWPRSCQSLRRALPAPRVGQLGPRPLVLATLRLPACPAHQVSAFRQPQCCNICCEMRE